MYNVMIKKIFLFCICWYRWLMFRKHFALKCKNKLFKRWNYNFKAMFKNMSENLKIIKNRLFTSNFDKLIFTWIHSMNVKFTGSCFLYIYRLIEEPKYELDNHKKIQISPVCYENSYKNIAQILINSPFTSRLKGKWDLKSTPTRSLKPYTNFYTVSR